MAQENMRARISGAFRIQSPKIGDMSVCVARKVGSTMTHRLQVERCSPGDRANGLERSCALFITRVDYVKFPCIHTANNMKGVIDIIIKYRIE